MTRVWEPHPLTTLLMSQLAYPASLNTETSVIDYDAGQLVPMLTLLNHQYCSIADPNISKYNLTVVLLQRRAPED